MGESFPYPVWFRGLLLFLLPFLPSSCTYTFLPLSCEYELPGRVSRISFLDSLVNETSGLVYLDGTFWTINDSGGEPELYGMDGSTGQCRARIRIKGGENVDWEDMASDGSYLYLADIGNNFQTRDTLEIYRISLASLSGYPESAEHAGIIRFRLMDSVVYRPGGLSSLDAEALLAYGDSLYLFTKNWVTENTSVYVLPSSPGTYFPSPRSSFPVKMLVTGADIDPARSEISLVGYRNYIPVVLRYSFDTSPASMECGGKARRYPLKLGAQTEGICFDEEGELYISAEKSLRRQSLFRVSGSSR